MLVDHGYAVTAEEACGDGLTSTSELNVSGSGAALICETSVL